MPVRRYVLCACNHYASENIHNKLFFSRCVSVCISAIIIDSARYVEQHACVLFRCKVAELESDHDGNQY